MDQLEVHSRLAAIFDELAAVEHERWAHWQRYIHVKGTIQPDGSLVLPSDLVRHWQIQIETPYAALTEIERESDREQVRRYLPLIANCFVDGASERSNNMNPPIGGDIETLDIDRKGTTS